ncbi:MAG: heavy-metal-associated domain-containing protein [Bacteroidetes bacterium]|nr:heavy-metal-associated domain-containing protein [Bacteroidota bacterium]
MKTTTLFLFLFIKGLSFGQKKIEEAIIQTSAQCGDCKERIEGKLNYTKGVVFAEFDLESKKVTVRYKTKSISLQEIKQTIASIGYSADGVKAKEEDILKLPKCCQPGGH